ncbi:MAG: hypothetical protein ACPIOQ_39095, partial [Promethearchaeia archaeon]
MDTRPQDAEDQAAAAEDEARASAAAAAAFADAETERLRMQAEADRTAQAKAAAEAETERLAGSLRPLHCRIGHDMARRDRPGWRERLEANFELALRERDLATDLRVLCGDL